MSGLKEDAERIRNEAENRLVVEALVLDEEIKQELIELARRYHLGDLILFGSRARGDCLERSDIDLAAHFSSRKEHLDFCEDVENIKTLLMFDVVNLSSDTIDLNLRNSIAEEGIVLYEKV